MKTLNKSNLNKIYQQVRRAEYKTPSIFGVLIILTILFVLIILGVQSDPIKVRFYQDKRSPTGTIE